MQKFKLGMFLACMAFAASAQQSSPQQDGRLKGEGAAIWFYAEPHIDTRLLHDCQLATGQHVKRLEVRENVEGQRVTLFKIRVVGGHCDGAEGWISNGAFDAVRQ